MLPAFFPFAACPNCPDQMKKLEHFLYKCPPKLLAWKSIWAEFFPSNVFSSFAVAYALFQLYFPSVSASILDLSPAAIVVYTLVAVWCSHCAFVFDKTLLRTSSIFLASQKLFLQSHQKRLIQNGCPHRALPHWSSG